MIAAICLACFFTGPMQDQGAPDLYKRVLPSVMNLTVQKKDGESVIGTAFLIDKKGLAATAWHVVNGATSVVAKFADGEQFDASGLVDKDEKRDVALIRIKEADRPALDLLHDEPPVGAKAYVVGSPLGLDFSITEGLVSQVRTVDDRKVIQFSCPSSPGNSGGPLIDADGKVLGVVSFQLVEGQNLNFAIPSRYLAGLDETLPTQPWSSVKASVDLSNPTPLFSVKDLGVPTWDGTRGSGQLYNLWRVVLLYKNGEPAIPKNAAIGFLSESDSGGKLDDRAISLYEANHLRKMLKEYFNTGEVASLKDSRGRFDLPTIQFVMSGILFRDEPLKVQFERSHRGLLNNGGRYVNFFFDGGARGLDANEGAALIKELDRWAGILAKYGIDVDKLTPDS